MDPQSPLSRRRFLQASASIAGAIVLPPGRLYADPPRLTVPPGAVRSRVVYYRNPKLVHGSQVHSEVMKEAFSRVLEGLTSHRRGASVGWRAFLESNDIVGLKFNLSSQDVLGTTPIVAATIIESLLAAGFSSRQIVCIEAPANELAQYDLLPLRVGFSDTVHDFGSGQDQLLAALNQITALINIPFLKTHNIAGITCACKNLSHGLVKHPARYHGGGCTPFIADILSLEPIRSKLRLTIVDGLRVVFDGGPSASADFIEDEGVILASTDPVAVDLSGLRIINEIRLRRRLAPVAVDGESLPYLADAHRKGLGIAVPNGIDTVMVSS